MRFTGGEWILKVVAALEAHAKPPVWRHGGQAPAKVPWMPWNAVAVADSLLLSHFVALFVHLTPAVVVIVVYSRHRHRSRTSRGSSPRFLVVTGYPGSQVPATTKTRSLTPRSTPPRNTMEAHIIPYCFLARSYIFKMLTTCFLTTKSLTLGGEFPDEPAKT